MKWNKNYIEAELLAGESFSSKLRSIDWLCFPFLLFNMKCATFSCNYAKF